jgi:hypothetical protein
MDSDAHQWIVFFSPDTNPWYAAIIELAVHPGNCEEQWKKLCHKAPRFRFSDSASESNSRTILKFWSLQWFYAFLVKGKKHVGPFTCEIELSFFKLSKWRALVPYQFHIDLLVKTIRLLIEIKALQSSTLPKFVRQTSSHQCTSSGWGRSSHFEDELKHIYLGHFYFPLPLPRVFSALFSAPEFSPPIYLPTSSPPKPNFIFSPTGLTSFFSPLSLKLRGELRNMETQGSLRKWRRKGVWSFNLEANVWAWR